MDNYGLNDTYDYYELELDSLDNSGSMSSGDSALDWPKFEIAGKTKLSNIAAIKVLSAEIPFSYYVFSSENNTFVCNIASVNHTITIPVGNYNATRLVNQLQQSLIDMGAGAFTVQMVDLTQKLKITGPASFSFTFGTTSDIGSTNPRLFMGFNEGTISCTGVMNAPNCVLLSGSAYLYLNSSIIGGLTNNYLPRGALGWSGGNSGPQLAKIPVNTQSGGIILYNDPDPQKYFSMEDINFEDIDLYLTMGNLTAQRPLRLNGLSFSVKIGVLLRRMNMDETQSGFVGQNRVQKRARFI